MASNGSEEAFAPSDVLGAVMTMRGGEQESKKKAHEYLERFQKSVRIKLLVSGDSGLIMCYRKALGRPSWGSSLNNLSLRQLYLPPSLCAER